MPCARKLALFVATTVGAMALIAPAAFGQDTSLEVTSEATGLHCPSVTAQSHGATGGCLIHIVSTDPVEVRRHIFGVETHAYNCNYELWARLDEQSEGFFVHQKLTPPLEECPRQACAEESGDPVVRQWEPWVAAGREAATPHPGYNESLQLALCINEIGQHDEPTRCDIDIPFRHVGDHRYEFGVVGAEMPSSTGSSLFRCEVVGHWMSETYGAGGDPDPANAAHRLENLAAGQLEQEVEIIHP